MLVRLNTAPASEPVTLAEAKAHLRLDTALDDTYVTSLITTARAYCEQVCWRGLVTQAWEIALPGFIGADRLELNDGRHYSAPPLIGSEWVNTTRTNRFLPYLELVKGSLAPLADLTALAPTNTSAVTSVKYIDPNGAQQTLPTTEYDVDAFSVPGRVRLAYGKSWPNTRDQWNAVNIIYWVGWTVANVPTPIKQAILLLVSQLYEHRTPEVIARAIVPIQFTFDSLIAPYRLNVVG